MTAAPPPPGTRVRLFFTRGRVYDGVILTEIDEGIVTLRSVQEPWWTDRVRWADVYSLHLVDECGLMIPREPALPLEMEG